MENPSKDIYKIFNLIDSVRSPELQKAAIEKFFLPDAAFKYPVFQVEGGPGSRDRVLKLYQWLHIVSPRTKGEITHAVYDKTRNILLLDVTQNLELVYLPFWKSKSRMLTRLTLKKQGGLHYIACQEDLMHPDDLVGLLMPPLKPMLSMLLIIIGVALGMLSSVFQSVGIFAVKKGKEDELKARRRRRRNKNGSGGSDESVSHIEMETGSAAGEASTKKKGANTDTTGGMDAGSSKMKETTAQN